MSDAAVPPNQLANPIEPMVLIIFGITGDLAKRKVLPALYHLLKDNLLPEQFKIIGTSRQVINPDEFLSQVELCVLEKDNVCDPDVLRRFRDCLDMLQLNPVSGDDYTHLAETLNSVDSQWGHPANRLFYLSIPPQVYGPIVRALGEHGLAEKQARLLVEKPFGYDLISAQELISETGKYFREEQIYRIDHYLAKESAQNILTFRQCNPLFSAIWDNQHIMEIQVTATESIGIEGRVDFYENVGALRDLIQSHLLQLLALVTMEVPEDIGNAEAIHAAKEAVLSALRPPAEDTLDASLVRAQYEGYREEVHNPNSLTETYASIHLSIDTPRWHTVPITLTTGKALREKLTEITIGIGDSDNNVNRLTFRVQPKEGIDVALLVKQPGYEHAIQAAHMTFSYESTFSDEGHPDAYERVLIDAARGDHALFATSGEVLASWRVLQPILDFWQNNPGNLQFYPPGSLGPS